MRAPPELCLLRKDITDLEAVEHWLNLKTKISPATLRAYLREIDRLLRWCWIGRGKALSDLSIDDFDSYNEFMKEPKPARMWICKDRVPRSDPRWRPFRSGMTGANRAYAFRIINELLSWMTASLYLRANVLGGNPDLKRSPKRHGKPGSRALTPLMWETLMHSIEAMPREIPPQDAEYERLRYLFTLLYLMDFRLGDLGNNTMQAFQEETMHGKICWWWRGDRKGGKEGDLPVSDEALEAVARYRRSKGITPELPATDDPYGMVMRVDSTKAIGTDRIAKLVTKAIRQALVYANDHQIPLSQAEIERFRNASTHWLRHTGITHQLERLPLHQVQRLAQHADPRMTASYVSSEDQSLHEAANLHRTLWPGSVDD